MRTLFRLLVVLPVAVVIVLFAVANRHLVMVSFDPFPGNDIQGPQLTAPLFLLLFIAGALGVLAGGMTVWFRQGRFRKQAREALLRKDATAHAVVRHSLGFETRTWPAFAEVLAERGPAAWSLGAVLEHECALVRGPIDVLSCPAAHAEWSTEVVQGRAPTTTEARAYFLPHGEGFELVAVLAGGRADVFTTDDEGRSIPARKWPKP